VPSGCAVVALLADLVELFVSLVVGIERDGDESPAVAFVFRGAGCFGEVCAAVAAGPVDAPGRRVEAVYWSAVAGAPRANPVVGFPRVGVSGVELLDVCEPRVLGFGGPVAFVSAFGFNDPFGLFEAGEFEGFEVGDDVVLEEVPSRESSEWRGCPSLLVVMV